MRILFLESRRVKETRKVFYVSCSGYKELVLSSGRMKPKQLIQNDNARAVFDHLQPFTGMRFSIGDANDWEAHPSFNDLASDLEAIVVTGELPAPRDEAGNYLSDKKGHL